MEKRSRSIWKIYFPPPLFFLNIYWPASRPAQWSLVLSGNDTNNPLLCQSQVEPQSLIRGGEEFYLSKRKSSFKAQWECSTPNETLAAIRCTSEAHRCRQGKDEGGKKNLYSTLMSSYCRAELSSNSFLSLILCQISDDKLHIFVFWTVAVRKQALWLIIILTVKK